MSFLTECVVPEDCPNGGINFKCIANECKCPSPFVLDSDKKCVGMIKILFVVLTLFCAGSGITLLDGGAIMARMDSSHPEAVCRHPKAQK